MTVVNCTYENNVGVEGGGAAADSHGHLDVRDSKFINNSAENGGGVDCTWGYLNLDNCILNNNSATSKGGGIACLFFESNVTNAILNDNRAPYGGGLYNIGNSILSNFNVNNNIAENGGGVYKWLVEKQ